MVFEQITQREFRQVLSEHVEDLVIWALATAGGAATVTLDDAARIGDDKLIDNWGYINDGTSEGDEFQVDDNVESTGIVTADQNFSSTPDTTSQVEIHSRFRVGEYNRAIKGAVRRWHRQFPVAEVKAEIVTNCALLNSTFRDWANGASSDPDNWSSSSEYVQQAITNPKLVAGEGKFIYRARVFTNSTNVILEVDDGTTQDTQAHDGSGFNLLELEHEPAAGATAVTVKIGHSGASAVSSVARSTTSLRGDYALQITWADGTVAIVDSVFAPTGYIEYKYSIPNVFRVLSEVNFSPSESNLTSLGARNRLQPLQRVAWEGGVDGQDPSKYVRFDPKHFRPADDIYLEVKGFGSATIPTTDDSVIEMPLSLITDWAAYLLLRPDQEGDRFRRDALEAAELLRVAYPANSHIIDPI
jgi:hypothetical protein